MSIPISVIQTDQDGQAMANVVKGLIATVPRDIILP